jgi:hypothetical protein
LSQNLSQTSSPLIGAWKLISFELQNSNGDVIYPFGENAQGTIIYTDSGRFSVQVFRPNRLHFASGDQMRGTLEEIKSNYESLSSYYGSYESDSENGFVVHHVEGSLFPNLQEQPQKRFYDLSGNRLKLRSPPLLWGGSEAVAVLIWERAT